MPRGSPPPGRPPRSGMSPARRRRAPGGRSPARPPPGGRAPGRPVGAGRPAGAGCAARRRSGRSGRHCSSLGAPDRLVGSVTRGPRSGRRPAGSAVREVLGASISHRLSDRRAACHGPCGPYRRAEPAREAREPDAALCYRVRAMRDRQDAEATAGVVDALDAATRAIAELQSVDDVLQVIVDQVRPLVGARLCGARDRRRGRRDRALHHVRHGAARPGRAIGPLPRGHGFLGLIIQENRSFRIPDIAVDPRRYGFPPNHPPMHSFLGVPVTVKGRSVGNLYLTDKAGADGVLDGRPGAGRDVRASTPGSRSRTRACTSRSSGWRSSTSASASARTSTTGSSRTSTPSACRSRTSRSSSRDDPDEVERRVERAIDSLHLTIRDIRNFIFGLRPELLSGTTLIDGLVAVVEEFRHNSMIDVELHVGDDRTSSPTRRRPPTCSASSTRR